MEPIEFDEFTMAREDATFMREFAARYDPNDMECIDFLRGIDHTFAIYKRLSGADIAPSRYLWRCEYPFNHFVAFNEFEVVGYLPPHCHEIIDGNAPYRMCFDIEHIFSADELRVHEQKPDYAGPAAHFNGLVMRFVSCFMEFVASKGKNNYSGRRKAILATFGKTMPASLVAECHALVSHRVIAMLDKPAKFSCHLIFPNFVVANSEAARHVAESFVKFLEDKGPNYARASKWIDLAIYKCGNMSFRGAGMTKRGENRPLIPIMLAHNWIPYKALPAHFVQQGVVPAAALVMPVDYKPRTAIQLDDVPNADFKKEILSKNSAIFAGWAFDSRDKKNIFPIKNTGGGVCPISGKEHAAKRQQYILLLNGRAYFKCNSPDCSKNRVKLNYGVSECELVRQHLGVQLSGMGLAHGNDNKAAETHCITAQYIGKIMAEAFEERPVIAVSSCMGSGKTTALQSILDNPKYGRKNVLMISFRKAFTHEKAAQLGLATYNKEYAHCQKYGSIKGPLENGLIIQAEALGRLSTDFVPSILILDEIEAIFSQLAKHEDVRSQFLAKDLAGNTLNGMRVGLNAATIFHHFVRVSRSIIALDANLTTNAVDYLAMTSNKATRLIINTYQHSGKAYIYGCEGDVIYNMIQTIKAGKKVAFVSDSKSEIDAATLKVAEIIGDGQCYTATGANPQQREQDIAANDGDASGVFDRYQFIAWNTSLLAGIDIHNRGRDAVFACFQNNFITPFAAMQLMGRLRNIEEIHFHARDVKGKRVNYLGALADSYGISVDITDLDVAKDFARRVDRLTKTLTKHEQLNDFGRSELRACLLSLLVRHGFEIRNMKAEAKISLDVAKKEAKAADSAGILEAIKLQEVRKAEASAAASLAFSEYKSEHPYDILASVDDFRPAIERMGTFQYKAAATVGEAFGIGGDKMAALTAEDIDDMRNPKTLERQQNINAVAGWASYVNPFDYGEDGEGLGVVDYTASKIAYAKAEKMSATVKELFGEVAGHIYEGEALSHEAMASKLDKVGKIWGEDEGDFKKRMAALNRHCGEFGFSITSTQRKKVAGKIVRSGYIMRPLPQYDVVKTNDGSILVYGAIWRLACGKFERYGGPAGLSMKEVRLVLSS